MAKQNKINMPSSGGGLTNFYGESGSKILLNPKVVVLAIIGFIILVLVIRYTFFGGLNY